MEFLGCLWQELAAQDSSAHQGKQIMVVSTESRDVAESWVMFEDPLGFLAGGALWFQLWCCNPLGRGREISKAGCGALFLSFLNSCLPSVCGYGNEAGKQVMQQQMSPLKEFSDYREDA